MKTVMKMVLSLNQLLDGLQNVRFKKNVIVEFVFLCKKLNLLSEIQLQVIW